MEGDDTETGYNNRKEMDMNECVGGRIVRTCQDSGREWDYDIVVVEISLQSTSGREFETSSP